MNYAEIKKLDVANSNGISCTLFVCGCTHKCYQCFNEDLQDFNYGNKWTEEVENKFIKYCKNIHVDNVCILGGEPFMQGKDLLHLLKRLKKEVNKPIWVWTGYTYEQIIRSDLKDNLPFIDILIDGKFVLELKDLNLIHKGSSNQRTIDVQKTLKQNKIILYNERKKE